MSGKVTYTSTDLGSAEANEAYEAALDRVRASFPLRVRSSVDGTEIDGVRTVTNAYPADTRLVLAEIDEASLDVLDGAIGSARRAFLEWGRTPWRDRLAAMRRVADRLEDRRYDIGALIAWETGKVRVEAVGEVDEAVELIRYYARCYEDNDGFAISMGSAEERAESVLRPWGTWGVISPFNFPLALATGMLAGVLLGGNTAVFKPASETAATGRELHEALAAELPAGAVQLVIGDGPELGGALVDRVDLDGFAFTGSREVGLASIARFTAARPRPFVAEMGGKNAVIVRPSANLDEATAGIVRSAFSLSGQKCSAASRVYVDADVADDLISRLREATGSLVVGDPHDRDTFVGPVIDGRAVARFREAADAASAVGRVEAGGRVLEDGDLRHGFFVEPTLVSGLPLHHPQFRHELFLPYVSVGVVTSLDTAIEEANAATFGLTAGIFTEEREEAERFLETIEAGTVYVNRARGATSGAWPGVQPFGGWKDSGSTGRHALGPRYVQQFMREQSRTIAR